MKILTFSLRIIKPLFLLLIIPQTHTFAQSGFPDPGFGIEGEVLTPTTDAWGHVASEIRAMALQDDGKIVAACDIGNMVSLVRYNTNGSLDTTFGDDGIAIGSISCDIFFGCGVAIQSDGKMVVGSTSPGFIPNGFALERFNVDGSVDASFGVGGQVTTYLDCDDEHVFTTVLIQPDGKIIGAGTAKCDGIDTEWQFALLRYNEDGSLDETFGDAGIVTDELGFWATGLNIGYSAALQPDGKVVMAGWSYAADDFDNFALMRWNTDGSRDTTFGDNGGVILGFGDDVIEIAYSVRIQDDGKIVAAGRANHHLIDSTDFALARYNSDGTFDTAFGTGGFVVTDLGDVNDEGFSIGLQSDGKIVVTGSSGSLEESHFTFSTRRYNNDGSIDDAFGTDGVITTDFGNDYSKSSVIVMQVDGKMVVGGFSIIDEGQSIALARYVSCAAYFTLYPDVTPHVWNAVNLAVGVEPMTYLWAWGDGTFSTEAYPSHTYADSGYYTICLTITDATGCSNTYCDSSTYIYRMTEELTMVTINVTNGMPTEIESFDSFLSVVPNPFSDQITIKYEGDHISNTFNGEIILFDIAGYKLISQPVISSETTINTSTLPPGIYFVYYQNGNERSNFKVVKI